jgi:general secretion pathway protein G
MGRNTVSGEATALAIGAAGAAIVVNRPMRRQGSSGFTLIELITVIAVVGILTAIALPNYRIAIVQSKEAVLKEDLYRFRDLIDQYYADKGRYPESLETLVEAGYLRKMPSDPMTGASDWQPVMAEPDPADPEAPTGVYDVKSASGATALDGSLYSEW